jgi:undecaprenyl-diphosphatase
VSNTLARLRTVLSPGGYFGLQIALGLLAFAATAWLFGGIAEDVVTGDPIVAFDQKVERWFHSHQTPWLNDFSSGTSHLFGGTGVTGAAILLLLHLMWRRDWRWVTTVICAVPGGMLLDGLLKVAFHRARATLSSLTAVLNTDSFPSGHVMAATLICGVAAAYFTAQLAAWHLRIFVGLAACFMIAVVAFSRVYLGVHFLSDVLAAVAAGLMWLSLSLVTVSTLWYRRARHRHSVIAETPRGRR